MKFRVRTTRILAAVLLTCVSAYAKPNIPDLAHQCNDLGKTKACQELAKIALTDKDFLLRRQAIDNLADQSVLAQIALTDQNEMFRTMALVKLTDQSALAKVAVGDKNDMVRRVAVVNLTDQSVLAKIAMEDDYAEVRGAALKKVTDQSLLAKIAVEDKKRAELHAVVLNYLAAIKYKTSAWSFSSVDTTIVRETINATEGKAALVAQVAFKGGTGLGVHMSNGATARFGATVGPVSGLPLYGFMVYPNNGSTFAAVSQTFFLVMENGAWKISGVAPATLPDPADTPLSPL